MRTVIFCFIVVLVISACNEQKNTENPKKIRPSHQYSYVDLAADDVNYLETDYIPIYSDIYHIDGTKRFLLTATLSIRNTSLTENAYVFDARYNDSYGKELRRYLDKTILLKPLESIEYVVEHSEDEGGAGASFIIRWGADKGTGQLLIQAVMTGTSNQQGLSFMTEAKKIDSREKQ